MSTTKRKRNDRKYARRCNKKRRVDEDNSKNYLDSLPNEMQLSILVHIPFEEYSSVRLVCSGWNQIITSSSFARAACINMFKNDLMPLRLSDPANLLNAPLSELYLFPTENQKFGTAVDWPEYLKLRCLLKKHFESNEMNKYWTELSYRQILAVLQNIKQNSSIHSGQSYYTFQLLVKLVPLAMQYNRIELADLAISSYVSFDFNVHPYKRPVQRAKAALELFAVAKQIHSSHTRLLYYCAMDDVEYITSRVGSKPGEPVELRKHLFKQAVVTMIHEGAQAELLSRRNNHQEKFELYFKVPPYSLYRHLVSYSNNDMHYLPLLVPLCREEFNKSATNWRVQMSAITVSNAVQSVQSDDYFQSHVEFALSVLGLPDLHVEVKRAAFFTVYLRVMRFGVQKMIPSEQARYLLLGYTNDALSYLTVPKEAFCAQELLARLKLSKV